MRQFFSYVGAVLVMASRHALTRSQNVIFLLLMGVYLLSLIPGIPLVQIIDGRLETLVFGSIVIIRLRLAPYWLDIADQKTIVELRSQLRKDVAETEKIPMVELFREAEKLGVDFKGESHAIMKVCQSLRQAACEGVLEFWGRDRHQWDPLLPIPKEHWHEYEINWPSAFEVLPSGGKIRGREGKFFCWFT